MSKTISLALVLFVFVSGGALAQAAQINTVRFFDLVGGCTQPALSQQPFGKYIDEMVSIRSEFSDNELTVETRWNPGPLGDDPITMEVRYRNNLDGIFTDCDIFVPNDFAGSEQLWPRILENFEVQSNSDRFIAGHRSDNNIFLSLCLDADPADASNSLVLLSRPHHPESATEPGFQIQVATYSDLFFNPCEKES